MVQRFPRLGSLRVALVLVFVAHATSSLAAPPFEEKIQPILEQYCFGCHGNGAKKGGVSLDGLNAGDASAQRELWWGVLKNVRAGIMPPHAKPQPTATEKKVLDDWIKSTAFAIDPREIDPGRVTVRRLNRVEYRNTIRDLIGVDYDTNSEFPADDTGHGFDNNGDVLTMSPLLLERYLAAASTVIGKVVPTVPRVMPRKDLPGSSFKIVGNTATPPPNGRFGGPALSYYEKSAATANMQVDRDGTYKLAFDLSANERFVDGVNDYNRCRVVLKADGKELLRKEFAREEGTPFHFEFNQDWKAGPHPVAIEVEPLTPNEKQARSLVIRIQSVSLHGPADPKFWVRPAGYERFFPRDVPEGPAERRAYAREILGKFATKAFRRPVDEATTNRLVVLAESISSRSGQTFEAGVAQAMTAVLTSPRFLFREEPQSRSSERFPEVDEFALASRLSYFLWSSMPDDELFRLASEGKLRANLKPQMARMLADGRSGEFFRNFVGQWLQARDIDSVIINAPAVILRDEPPDPEAERRRTRFRELARKPAEELTAAEKKELQEARAAFPRNFRRFREFELTGDLRLAMRRETEMLVEHIVREDRSLLEVLDCNYTFLNERLARHYGIEGVTGDRMRKVELPKGSPRGGILTQATVLAVTSNPDRTSPVKRGLYILDNILGSPPAPPPPNIPSLEEAGRKGGGKPLTVREQMVLHRDQPLCASCHARMDPLGLALENFNALGRFREKERTTAVDASGKLITGEPFQNVQDLKRVLVTQHRREFYQCLTEKMLTYALGRGLEATDVETVDAIVARIERDGGKASALVAGVVESVPFQRMRGASKASAANDLQPSTAPAAALNR